MPFISATATVTIELDGFGTWNTDERTMAEIHKEVTDMARGLIRKADIAPKTTIVGDPKITIKPSKVQALIRLLDEDE